MYLFRRVSTTVDPYWDISLELNGCSAKQNQPSSTAVLDELITNLHSSDNSSNELPTTLTGTNDVSAKSLEECLRK